MFSKNKLMQSLKHYISNVVLIWLAIIIYRFNNYYASFLKSETQVTLLYLAVAYTILGFIYYIVMPLEKIEDGKSFALLKAIKKTAVESYHYIKNFTSDPDHPLPKMDKKEKTALLFFIVKFLYLPIMLNFVFNNYNNFHNFILDINRRELMFNIDSFNDLVFPAALTTLFLIDVLFFAFGYTFEAGFLRNKIRSVEPTVLGWFAALACYPPLSYVFNNFVLWHPNDYAYFYSDTITFYIRIVILVFIAIYVWATIALGTKCSNLTNRGIVSGGPYRYIRHPAYICKNLAWWLTIIPIMSIPVALSMTVWSFIYYLRAITEERHLIRDPDYQEYCRKVRYRFIPKLW